MKKINLFDNSKPADWFGCVDSAYKDGFARVMLSGKYSFINQNGVLIGNGNILFDNAFPFSEGFARVVIHDKYTFIDKNGKLISYGTRWFDYADDFYGDFALIKINDKWYKLRKDGVLCNEDTNKPINQSINDTIKEEFTYVIPKGYYVIIKENKVTIKKNE